MIKVMFLCTGNAFRSQMADGFARHYGSDVMEVHSAGVMPIGVSPWAVKAMAEEGIDISRQTSDPIDPELLARMDLVVTLCGNAAALCPATPPGISRIHWPVDDPLHDGPEDVVMASNRKTREDVKARVMGLVERLRRGEEA